MIFLLPIFALDCQSSSFVFCVPGNFWLIAKFLMKNYSDSTWCCLSSDRVLMYKLDPTRAHLCQIHLYFFGIGLQVYITKPGVLTRVALPYWALSAKPWLLVHETAKSLLNFRLLAAAFCMIFQSIAPHIHDFGVNKCLEGKFPPKDSGSPLCGFLSYGIFRPQVMAAWYLWTPCFVYPTLWVCQKL